MRWSRRPCPRCSLSRGWRRAWSRRSRISAICLPFCASMAAFKPDIVIHMAAQPLVRLSYREPIETYATNVMGTAHVLESARRLDTVRCIVCVTSDKCYENQECDHGYSEDQPMGGHDPYSSSKGCAELADLRVSTLILQRHEGPALASVRAGNVIGGGRLG